MKKPARQKRNRSSTQRARRRWAAQIMGHEPRAAQGWMAEAEHLYRPVKKPVTLRLDADVLIWFKAQGRGYQTRINQVLRGLMLKSRKSAR